MKVLKSRVAVPILGLCLWGVACFLMASPSRAQDMSGAGVRIEYAGLNYDDLSVHRLRLRLRLQLQVPRDDISLVEIRFDDLTANGIPLSVEPYTTPVDLRKDELVELAAPILVSLYFRELSSLDPLRQLLKKRTVVLRGTIHVGARIRKGVLKVLTLGQVLRKRVEFEREVPFVFLENSLAKMVAEQVLNELEDPNSLLGTKWLDEQLQLQALVRRGKELEPGLVPVVTGYQFAREGDAGADELEQSATGFFVSPDLIVTTKQALEPWKYDPELAYLRQSGYRVRQESYDVAVLLARQASGSQPEGRISAGLRGKGLKVEESPRDDMQPVEYYTGDTTVSVPVHRRSTWQNLVLLKVRKREQRGIPLPMIALPAGQELILGLTYFRMAEGERIPYTSWALATAGESGVLLDRSFPDEAVGAPVFDDKGRVRAIFVGGDRCLPIQLLQGLTKKKLSFQGD